MRAPFRFTSISIASARIICVRSAIALNKTANGENKNPREILKLVLSQCYAFNINNTHCWMKEIRVWTFDSGAAKEIVLYVLGFSFFCFFCHKFTASINHKNRICLLRFDNQMLAATREEIWLQKIDEDIWLSRHQTEGFLGTTSVLCIGSAWCAYCFRQNGSTKLDARFCVWNMYVTAGWWRALASVGVD